MPVGSHLRAGQPGVGEPALGTRGSIRRRGTHADQISAGASSYIGFGRCLGAVIEQTTPRFEHLPSLRDAQLLSGEDLVGVV